MSVIGSETDLLGRLLAASELRSRVITSNIANSNTPGFTRQVVRFEELLRGELRRGGSGAARVAPAVLPDTGTPARPDGNNVTLELELNGLRENRLLYETYASILRGHFAVLDAAISGGR